MKRKWIYDLLKSLTLTPLHKKLPASLAYVVSVGHIVIRNADNLKTRTVDGRLTMLQNFTVLNPMSENNCT
jgi:hypothetical protein